MLMLMAALLLSVNPATQCETRSECQRASLQTRLARTVRSVDPQWIVQNEIASASRTLYVWRSHDGRELYSAVQTFDDVTDAHAQFQQTRDTWSVPSRELVNMADEAIVADVPRAPADLRLCTLGSSRPW
jgi:hypothetical protein